MEHIFKKQIKVDDFEGSYPLENVMDIQIKIPTERLIDAFFRDGKEQTIETLMNQIRDEIFSSTEIRDLLLK